MNSESILDVLVTSTARAALLRLVFGDRLRDSVSGFARRAGLTPKAVALEVRRIEAAGLLRLSSIGPSTMVEANWKHPAATLIASLVSSSSRPGPVEEPSAARVRAALIAHGAPLMVDTAQAHARGSAPASAMSLEDAIVAALRMARFDGTVLRVLPATIARNRHSITWARLREAARFGGVKQELGMLVTLTANLLGEPSLKAQVRGFRDRRRRRLRFYPEPRSSYERELAMRRSPRVARQWGFLMNLSEDSFRSTLQKHLA